MKGLLAVAALIWVLSGCAALPTRAPDVSVAGVDILDFGLFEQRFGLKLRLRNPNDADIPITGLSFEIEVNGRPFARGVSDKAVTLPRYGEAVLEVDATSNLGRLLRQLDDLARESRETIGYRVHGQLSTANLGSVPFDATGDLRLPRSLRDRREKSGSGST